MKVRVPLIIAALLPIVGGVLIACAPTTPPAEQDLDPDAVTQDRGARTVYVNPDKFPNVVAFCDGNTRIYVTTRDMQSPLAVSDHPLCQR